MAKGWALANLKEGVPSKHGVLGAILQKSEDFMSCVFFFTTM